jgi:hypothetical protein
MSSIFAIAGEQGQREEEDGSHRRLVDPLWVGGRSVHPPLSSAEPAWPV